MRGSTQRGSLAIAPRSEALRVTTAMREGFVALGRSLEAASGPIDEAGLVERLCKLATEESGGEEFSRGGAEARRVRTKELGFAQSGFLG